MESKFLQLSVKSVSRIQYSIVFVQVLEFGSQHDLFDDDLLEFLRLLEILVKWRTVWCLDPLLAIWAIKIVEYYTWSIPLLLNLFSNTVQVENVPTF